MTKDTTRSETPLTHEEVIWNNRKILINGNPVFYKSWFDQNVIQIQDLLQEDGKFLSFKNFCNQFKFKTPFTLYFGLINSILSSWRLASENPPSLCPENEEKEKIISTKYVYNWESTKHGSLVHGPPPWTGSMDRVHQNMDRVHGPPIFVLTI